MLGYGGDDDQTDNLSSDSVPSAPAGGDRGSDGNRLAGKTAAPNTTASSRLPAMERPESVETQSPERNLA